MTLIENLQAHLTRLRDRPGSFTPPSGEELAQLRQHLRARFEEGLLQADLAWQGTLAREFHERLDYLADFALKICWNLELLGIRETERLEALRTALDMDLPGHMSLRPDTAQTMIWRAGLHEIVRRFHSEAYTSQQNYAARWTLTPTIMRYATELRLIRHRGNLVEVTSMGDVLLHVIGRDAIRWLLAVEVVQSTGPDDQWRMSHSAAATLASMTPWLFLDSEQPCTRSTLERCEHLQLLARYEDDEDGLDYYAVRPVGRELLHEAGTQDTPFTLMAQAMVADQTQAVLATLGNSSPNAAAEATVRHTRMVAHEIRNALVPVRVAMKQLWRDLDQAGQEAVTREPRQAIDGNIERIFRFLDESIRLSRLASAPPEVFALLPSIHDAIGGLEQPPRGPIEPEIEPGADAVHVRGHRQRLVLALVNLLRNAVQAGGPDVAIEIQVAAMPEHRRIQIIVDDDGPGIAPEQRGAIFQNGVSHRSDGTGHGLTLVREVIEREMSGKIACENSPRGGARFLIELPWA